MGNLTHHPAAFAPAPAVMEILNRFNREDLGHAIEVLIALLDLADGEPDAESGTDGEDDFLLTANAIERAIDAPLSNPIDHDAGAWIEWETLRANLKRGPNITAGHEDDEEDDPSGQCDEDGINTELGLTREDNGAGCTISDSDLCDVERGEVTTYEEFGQGVGSARHEDDDEEPWHVSPHWPLGDGEDFRFRPAAAND